MVFRKMWVGDTRSRKFKPFEKIPSREGILQHVPDVAQTLLALSPIMT